VPQFIPFRGLRYSPSVPLDLVIAPPYDVVDSRQRAELAQRHPANSILVELPAADDRSGLDPYENAETLLAEWRRVRIVRHDLSPAFYAYRMTTPAGATTTGVIGALGLEKPGGDVLPHEQTIPKDKTDRLELLRACRANLSPIWGLSLSDGLAATYQTEQKPDAEATDDDGVLHQLWVLDDPGTIQRISEAVGRSPVVIADGHHRYETALTYEEESRSSQLDGTRPASSAPGDEFHGEDYVMAFVVELAEDQLTVEPIHRSLVEVPDDVDLVEAFGNWFEVAPAGPPEEKFLESLVASRSLALVTRDGVWLLTPLEAAYQAASSDLDSAVMAAAVASIPGASTRHHHDWREAVEAVEAGDADAALVLRPVTVPQIAEWAHDRRRMPPKSTYFYPKPRTGMVFRTLDDPDETG